MLSPRPDTPASEAITLSATDGVALELQAYGQVGHRTLLFAHGFGQTRHAWSGSAARLADVGLRCVIADARGHGDSGWRTDGQYDIDQFVGDLVTLNRYTGPDTVLVGASLGGLLGLIAQADHAPLFRALVLVDITPRWESSGVERILDFMRAHPDGFDSLQHAADVIAAYLPHRRERKSPQQLNSLLVQRDDGRYRWHWDARLLAQVATDGERHQARLLDAARRIDVPILLLSGGASDVVSQATIAEFLQLAPHAKHVVVPRATHMVVGDRNDEFTDAVLSFVRTLDARGADSSRS